MTEYKRISEIDRVNTVTDDDLFIIETAQGTRVINRAAFKTEVEEITKGDIGLGNVDNTADLDKPISNATQEALDAKVDTASFNTALNDYMTKEEANDTFAAKAGMAGTYLSKLEATAYYVSRSDFTSLAADLTAFVKQTIVSLTANTVTLEANKIYSLTPTGNVTITLADPTDTTILNQIILQLNLETVRTINVGTTYYINKKAPNLSATGNYNLIWEWDKACSKWVCGLLSKGEA